MSNRMIARVNFEILKYSVIDVIMNVINLYLLTKLDPEPRTISVIESLCIPKQFVTKINENSERKDQLKWDFRNKISFNVYKLYQITSKTFDSLLTEAIKLQLW